jgi:hypothetical protein
MSFRITNSSGYQYPTLKETLEYSPPPWKTLATDECEQFVIDANGKPVLKMVRGTADVITRSYLVAAALSLTRGER